jgi:arylsulfatase A-like enzyme
VHGQYELPASATCKFADPKYGGKYKGTVDEYWELRNKSIDQGFLKMNSKDVAFWKSIYDAKIHEADRKLGAFIQKLEGMDMLDRTIIIISSGSGNEYYEHQRFDHGFSLYDELIRVPLIVRLPNLRGRVIPSQVRTIDIMPTVLEILGIDMDKEVKSQMQGISLVPLMHGRQVTLYAFSETEYLLSTFKRSIRTDDGWKFIYTLDTEERELYNLKKDPKESLNLVQTEIRHAYELEQKLLKHFKSVSLRACAQ